MGETNYEPIYDCSFGEGKGAGGVVGVAIDWKRDKIMIGAGNAEKADHLEGSLSVLIENLEGRSSK